MAYRSIKFFMPHGGIDSINVKKPLGWYQASRYSLGVPGRIVRSAFFFYENDEDRERLLPFGYYDDPNVLRFKELRKIKNDAGREYQIISGGLVFANRQCFVAIGATYETRLGVAEKDLKASDIQHAQTAYYVFDDDGDADVVRGLKIGVLRLHGDPVAPTIELRRVKMPEGLEWSSVGDQTAIEIGIVDPKAEDRTDLAEVVERIRPRVHDEAKIPFATTFNKDMSSS
ncbi:hypothetical protein ACEWPN_00805 [Yoonia sp. R2-816]